MVYWTVTGYFSLIPWCKVGIQHNLFRGDQGAIKDAISLLRKTDYDSYKVFCGNIDVIYERYCPGADWHFEDINKWRSKPGCYIRGSRAMYLTPSDEYSVDTSVEARASYIKRFSEYSDEFWVD